MTSLLQHHGCTTTHRPGRVELLMYLVRDEETPMRCMHCGHPYEYVDGFRCSNCSRYITHTSYRDATGVADSSGFHNFREHWSNAVIDAIRDSRVGTTYVSNSWDIVDVEPVRLMLPKGETVVPRLYRIWRKPLGLWGPWVEFRWNNQVHVPDLSVPIHEKKLPRDAEPLTEEEAVRYWSS